MDTYADLDNLRSPAGMFASPGRGEWPCQAEDSAVPPVGPGRGDFETGRPRPEGGIRLSAHPGDAWALGIRLARTSAI
jgi:hypothetical protein